MRIDPAILLVALAALGAAGLYLALAGRRRRLNWAALLLLVAAGGALLALAAPRLAGGPARGSFCVLALIGVLGAVRMITHPRPVYSALYFLLVVVAVAGLLVLMQADFLAAALFIIYAGAILVTYLFVIMLAQQSGSAGYDRQPREPFLGCVAGFVLLTVIAARLFIARVEPAATAGPADLAATLTTQPVRAIGTVLLTDYVVVLQAVGVLLLAAMVGAIAIARRRPDAAELGESD
jgi:NADH-quinone oxidoreductase subunit J